MGTMPGGYRQDFLALGFQQFLNFHGHIFSNSANN